MEKIPLILGLLYQICFKKTFPEAEMPLIYADTTSIKPSGEDGGCPRCGGAVFQVRIAVFCIVHIVAGS